MDYKFLLRRSWVIFFQVFIILIGVGVFAFLLWEPQVEGVNEHATNFEIYFKDPFLAFVYIGSVPFFVALCQTFKVLGYIRQNNLFSQATVKALQIMKYCALIIIGFVVMGEIFIMLNDSDDRAGGFFMGVIVAIGSIVIATATVSFERILNKRLIHKSSSRHIK